MKRILLFCLLFANIAFAQNLVLNPNFEDYDNCPGENGDFSLNDWEIVGGTADFFHACFDNDPPAAYPVGVPSNFAGSQSPVSGEGYVGAASYVSLGGSEDVREYFAGRLSSPLVVGTTYYASVMVSFSDLSSHACNNVGLKFINADLLNGSPTNNPVTDNTADIYSEEIVTDTTIWFILKGSFVADDTYEYMAIGNFFDDNNTDTLFIQEADLNGISYEYSYFYYDNACVSAEPGVCFPVPVSAEDLKAASKIKLYPNPVNDKVRFEHIDRIANIKMTDIIGRTVVHTVAQNEVDISHLQAGVYFVHFENAESMVLKVLKLVKQ